MKTFIKILFASLTLLVLVYVLGPKMPTPDLGSRSFSLPESLPELELLINTEESNVLGIKPDNQARIVWADSLRKEKTKIAFLYLHGFTASIGDGMPVHTNLASSFKSNLYIFRNAHHGVELGDENMRNAKSDDYLYEAEKALSIARRLGDEVVVIGTSLGAALTLHLASKYPDIKAIVLYAPPVVVNNRKAMLVTGPWGYQLTKLSLGSEYLDNPDTIATHKKYWQMHRHVDGMISVVNLVAHMQSKESFARIKCPVFLGYYYKNEQQQDMAASVPAMKEMFEMLGTSPDLKRQVAFPEAGDHVIASRYTSREWERVGSETESWLRDVVLR